jgi:hypothetical protein
MFRFFEKREARSEKREARSQKQREARSEKPELENGTEPSPSPVPLFRQSDSSPEELARLFSSDRFLFFSALDVSFLLDPILANCLLG